MEEAKEYQIVRDLHDACIKLNGKWEPTECTIGKTKIYLSRNVRGGLDIGILSPEAWIFIKGLKENPFVVKEDELRIELPGEDYDTIIEVDRDGFVEEEIGKDILGDVTWSIT